MGHQPDQIDVGVGCGGDCQARRQLRVTRAEAPHAGVELHVHATPAPYVRGQPRDVQQVTLAPHDQIEAAGDHLFQVVALQRTHDQQRRLGHCDEVAQLARFLDAGDGQPGGAARKRRPRAFLHAVAVAVGLDNRAQLDALAQLRAQPLAVARDRVEVDARNGAIDAHGRSTPARRRGRSISARGGVTIRPATVARSTLMAVPPRRARTAARQSRPRRSRRRRCRPSEPRSARRRRAAGRRRPPPRKRGGPARGARRSRP